MRTSAAFMVAARLMRSLVSSCATDWHTTPTAPARVFIERCRNPARTTPGGERRTPLVKHVAPSSAWLGLGLLMSACAMLQAQDFQQAVDHLSQGDVLARWGLPQAVVAGTEGETLWIYALRIHARAQSGEIVVTSPGWVVPGGWRCTQYLFRFDRMQVLRGWTARRC
jgi:hypothetical protein